MTRSPSSMFSRPKLRVIFSDQDRRGWELHENIVSFVQLMKASTRLKYPDAGYSEQQEAVFSRAIVVLVASTILATITVAAFTGFDMTATVADAVEEVVVAVADVVQSAVVQILGNLIGIFA